MRTFDDENNNGAGFNTVSLDNDEDPIANSPMSFLRSFSFPLYLIFWHMLACTWDLIYYVTWARFNETLLDGRPSPNIILGMIIISQLAFWTVGAPFLLYSAKYAITKKKRTWGLNVALLVLFLLSEMPSLIIHMTILHNFGWVDRTQGIAAVLRVSSAFGSAYLVWNIYMSWMTKFLTRSIWSPEDELKEMAKKRQKDLEMRQRKNIPVYR